MLVTFAVFIVFVFVLEIGTVAAGIVLKLVDKPSTQSAFYQLTVPDQLPRKKMLHVFDPSYASIRKHLSRTSEEVSVRQKCIR